MSQNDMVLSHSETAPPRKSDPEQQPAQAGKMHLAGDRYTTTSSNRFQRSFLSANGRTYGPTDGWTDGQTILKRCEDT